MHNLQGTSGVIGSSVWRASRSCASAASLSSHKANFLPSILTSAVILLHESYATQDNLFNPWNFLD